jgi:hypothetical protein
VRRALLFLFQLYGSLVYSRPFVADAQLHIRSFVQPTSSFPISSNLAMLHFTHGIGGAIATSG